MKAAMAPIRSGLINPALAPPARRSEDVRAEARRRDDEADEPGTDYLAFPSTKAAS